MIKLLFVEDDDNYAYAVQGGLELFDVYEVQRAANGRDALTLYNTFRPDVVVSDIEMPGMNGYDLARSIREKDREVIILLATGLISPRDLHKGYRLDIDEYVKKPYIAEELHDRIQAILRRMRKTGKSDLPTVTARKANSRPLGNYTFDADERTLSLDNKVTQKLTPLETQILSLLLENRNRLVLRADILQRFWAMEDSEFTSRSLDVFITKLRKYLSQDPSLKIVNERGKGLRLEMG